MDTDVLEQRTAIDYHDCSHWWLGNITTDKVYVFADQYYHVGQIPPYVDGRKNRVWLETTTPEDARSNGQSVGIRLIKIHKTIYTEN